MSNGKSPILWIYDHAPTRWVIVGVIVAIVFLFSDIVQVLAARPWWEDLIVVMAAVAVPVLAFFELRHSGEANRLRDEANEERRKANRLTEQNTQLSAELDAERNRLVTNRDKVGFVLFGVEGHEMWEWLCIL